MYLQLHFGVIYLFILFYFISSHALILFYLQLRIDSIYFIYL